MGKARQELRAWKKLKRQLEGMPFFSASSHSTYEYELSMKAIQEMVQELKEGKLDEIKADYEFPFDLL